MQKMNNIQTSVLMSVYNEEAAGLSITHQQTLWGEVWVKAKQV